MKGLFTRDKRLKKTQLKHAIATCRALCFSSKGLSEVCSSTQLLPTSSLLLHPCYTSHIRHLLGLQHGRFPCLVYRLPLPMLLCYVQRRPQYCQSWLYQWLPTICLVCDNATRRFVSGFNLCRCRSPILLLQVYEGLRTAFTHWSENSGGYRASGLFSFVRVSSKRFSCPGAQSTTELVLTEPIEIFASARVLWYQA